MVQIWRKVGSGTKTKTFKSWNRNHNFSKVRTGTVINSYGSTTLDPDPLVTGSVLGIRIRTKMSWIPNTRFPRKIAGVFFYRFYPSTHPTSKY